MSHPAAEMAYEEVLERAADEQAAPRKKRSKGKSPTARTLEECSRRGWIAGVVERHIPFPKPMGTKIDLFGCIDVVVVVPPIDKDGNGWPEPGYILGIQATASAAHHAHRRTKILAEPRMRAWVEAGGQLELWSWSKRVGYNKDGTKAKLPKWTLRVETYAEMVAGQSSSAE